MMLRQKGYTLIEVVVAMVLFSLLMLILYQSLVLAVDAWTGQNFRGYYAQARRILQLRMRNELNNAFFSGSKRYPGFIGKEDTFAFLQDKGDSLREFAVEFLPSKGTLCWRSGKWEGKLDGGDKNVPVLYGLEKVVFRYYNPAKERWQTEWDDKKDDGLPSLLEIQLIWRREGKKSLASEPVIIPIYMGLYSREGA